MTLSTILQKLVRKKVLSDEDVQQTNLKRCLTTLDLIGLGIGCTLGAGLYVVSGQVSKENSGPSIVISFLIAAIASAFAGLCYAEFAARIPRAGSAYIYSYVTVGEFMAFVIGWNLVLEYIIGAASVARGWSNYFNSLVDNRIQDFFNSTMPMRVSGLSEYPDFLAFFITMVVTAILAFGVKESALITSIFTVVNLVVVVYITICGLFKIDWHNWNLSKEEVPADAGEGGFMPFGFSGMMAGAATCFYAFVGFDAIATTGEEAKNPQKSIPLSIIISLLLIFLSYFCVSGIMTLMCPYYLLDIDAPLPKVFEYVGWGVARYIISTGAIAGLTTSLIGGMFPLPRILYAMGTDGVIFKFLGKISPRFQTPLVGTFLSGTIGGLMAMLFNLGELVSMMSIGTLMAYTLVAVSVLILRYEADEEVVNPMSSTFKFKDLFRPEVSSPTHVTSRIAKVAILSLCIILTLLAVVLIFLEKQLQNKDIWVIFLATFFALASLTCTSIIQRQPQSSKELFFKVPFLPFLPALSCFINIYLMLKLSAMTWVRFVVWLVIGFIVYVTAGYMYAPVKEKKISMDSTEEKAEIINAAYYNETSMLVTK